MIMHHQLTAFRRDDARETQGDLEHKYLDDGSFTSVL
jgi:hypothetical protein